MRYRRLGRYGVRVSEVALGGWLTHGRTLDDSTTERIVHKAIDLGVNFFDTADVYHNGEGERALGLALHGVRRESVFVATKCFWPMGDGPNDRGLSRKHIVESVHNSLKRLKLDYIDLFQFHRFDPEVPLDESIRAVDDLIRAGKILYWGTSEWRPEGIAEAVGIAKALNAHPPVSEQPRYSMLAKHIERDVMPTAARHGMGLVAYSPLAQGVLSGKYAPGEPAPAGSRGADETSNHFMKDALKDDLLARVQRLKAFANEQGHPLATFALAWALRKPEMSSVIIGATSTEQLEANAAASGLELSSDVWTQAETILYGEAA